MRIIDNYEIPSMEDTELDEYEEFEEGTEAALANFVKSKIIKTNPMENTNLQIATGKRQPGVKTNIGTFDLALVAETVQVLGTLAVEVANFNKRLREGSVDKSNIAQSILNIIKIASDFSKNRAERAKTEVSSTTVDCDSLKKYAKDATKVLKKAGENIDKITKQRSAILDLYNKTATDDNLNSALNESKVDIKNAIDEATRAINAAVDIYNAMDKRAYTGAKKLFKTEKDMKEGTEGVLSFVKEKFTDAMKKRKERREAELKKLNDEQRAEVKNGAYKVVTKAEFDKIVSNTEKIVQAMYKELESRAKKEKLKVEISMPDVDFLVGWEDLDNGAFPLILEIYHLEDIEAGDGTWERFDKIFDDVCAKYYSKLDFDVDYAEYNNHSDRMFIYQEGYYFIEEANEATESKIVEAIYNEFGVEGLTSVIRNLIK